jgi:hypothetical protein
MGGVYSDFLGDGKRDSFDTQLGAGITIYLDLDNDGHRQGNEPTTTTDSSGSYSFSNLADGTYFVRIIPPNGTTQSGPTNGAAIQVIIAGGATYAGRDFGVMQPAPPIRVAAQFNPDNALLITLAFNADVSASLDRDDLKVVNLTTGTTTDMSAFTFNESLAGPSTLATWSATSHTDGNYRITLPAGSVSAGNDSLSADYTYDFFVLNADGDRNRTVNILDFNILATNFGKTGQTFSQGNYNYSTDGRVDINDFNVLAGNFGKHLDPLTTAQSVTAQPTAAIGNSTVTTAAALQTDDQRVADLVLA